MVLELSPSGGVEAVGVGAVGVGHAVGSKLGVEGAVNVGAVSVVSVGQWAGSGLLVVEQLALSRRRC